MSCLFSILIPTIPERVSSALPRLLEGLQQQISHRSVEVLALYDNKKRSVGAKRNALLQMSQGIFVSFIDDDDMVAPDYVYHIMTAILGHMDADVICFKQICEVDTRTSQLCHYSLSYDYELKGGDWYGKPAHTMVWRGALARACTFPEKNFREDVDWVAKACELAKTEVQLDRVLYYYKFQNVGTTTRDRVYIRRNEFPWKDPEMR